MPAGVSLAPVIPFVNEPEIEAVLEAARAAGASLANDVVLQLPNELVPVFHDWLDEHVADRRPRVAARLREMRGGRDNDPRFGWRMRGTGPWAEMIRMRIDVRLRRLGIGRERPSLRCDLLERPGAAQRGRGAVPSPPSPVQGRLF